MLKNMSVPDVPVPDTDGLADEIRDLAEAAVDAVSSAAGLVPGLDDYRAINRRRRKLLWGVGTIGVLVIVVLMVKKNTKSNDDQN